jgi:large subunit ribosomal protein L17
MKKQKKGRKFHRKTSQREALIQGLARSLVLKEKIKTTEAKAKELSSFVEKNITKAGKGTLQARRDLQKIYSPDTAKKLIEDIAPLYKNRPGGYTRIIKLGQRKSDGTKMAIIELVK